ncbi:hypothetical protein BvCmsKKP038_04778 [Escherichia coli]|nr:hypothetical protein BvCmsKKP038_04778 [Escherichia coli]GEI18165.1 hypothetical protein EC161867_00754 [Escherichia coli O145:H25]
MPLTSDINSSSFHLGMEFVKKRHRHQEHKKVSVVDRFQMT